MIPGHTDIPNKKECLQVYWDHKKKKKSQSEESPIQQDGGTWSSMR